MRSYKFRLYPTRKQKETLSIQLQLCQEMYNILLQSCKVSYRTEGKTLNKYALNNIIKEIKASDARFKTVHSQVLQNISDRIHKAYSNFFRRCKEKKSGKNIKVGFPRFKKFYKSITYPQSGFKILSDKRLSVAKIGNIPIVLHRVPKGTIKTMAIKRMQSGKWFACFSSELPESSVVHPHIESRIGIDVGLESFATFNDGTKIENPRYLISSERKLALAQRRLSRKNKGSANRRKAILKVARLHERIANQRIDFLHKLSRVLIDRHGIIAVENLNICNIIHNHHLSKHISDASWNTFTQFLDYKASSAGGQVVFVNPNGTSQKCSNCGIDVPKTLSDRIHKCPNCNLILHRDHNSAINILNKINNNTVGLTEIHACGNSASTLSIKDRASRIVETGTINDL